MYSAITKIIKSPISTRILPVFFSLRNFFFFKLTPSFVFYMSFTHILSSFSSKYSEYFIISHQHIVPLSFFKTCVYDKYITKKWYNANSCHLSSLFFSCFSNNPHIQNKHSFDFLCLIPES